MMSYEFMKQSCPFMHPYPANLSANMYVRSHEQAQNIYVSGMRFIRCHLLLTRLSQQCSSYRSTIYS